MQPLVCSVLLAALVAPARAALIDATSGLSRGQLLTAINAGGDPVTSLAGDTYSASTSFVTGSSEIFLNPDGLMTLIANAEPWEYPLFNSMQRAIKPDFNLAYTLPLPSADTISAIEVELLFAELVPHFTESGKRRFDVFLNGELALEEFDIFVAAGGARERAVRVSFFMSPAPETVVVTFGKGKNKPALNGMVVYNVSGAPSSNFNGCAFDLERYHLAHNCGGRTFVDAATGIEWLNDDGFFLGQGDPHVRRDGVIANTAPELYPLYNAERSSKKPFDLEYILPLGPADTYVLRLHFSEKWRTKPNQRLFDIVVDGKVVLADLDVFAAAGGRFAAYVLDVVLPPVTVENSIVTLSFGRKVRQPFISGIQVGVCTATTTTPTVATSITSTSTTST